MAKTAELAFEASYPDIAAVFRISPETGDVVWVEDRVGAGGRIMARAGDVAGWRSNGRQVIQIGGIRLFGHRIAWRLHYGAWPDGIVDHIDLNPANNRIENLRIATESQNRANTRPRARCGFKGVTTNKHASGFVAQITVDGKNKYLGRFRTPEQAHAAYCEAARVAFGEFARVG